jgi:hypothetical protein
MFIKLHCHDLRSHTKIRLTQENICGAFPFNLSNTPSVPLSHIPFFPRYPKQNIKCFPRRVNAQVVLTSYLLFTLNDVNCNCIHPL